ncbi:MAG: DUF2029 domain-containing protein [Planctomycetes bacterium]|nr:DUF2029 domain-containing protein [Planctomycetota bacterium]
MKARAIDWPRGLYFVLAALLALSALKGYRTCISDRGNDLTIYLDAARAVLEGRSPMEVVDYIYLPVMAVAISPLGWLPMPVAALLWQLASWLAILWSAQAVAGLVGSGRSVRWIPFICLLCTYRLADSNLSYGQANAFTLAALLKALQWTTTDRNDAAGRLAGAATAFKILPGIFLILLFVRGKLRSAAQGLLMFAALAILLPWAAFGWHMGWQVQSDWFHQVFEPYMRGGHALLEARPYLPGQSLLAITYHSLVDTPISANHPELRANFVSWDPDVAHWIVRALIAFHLGAFVFAVYRKRRAASNLVPNAALALCTVILIGPLVHRAHMVWSMLAVGWLFHHCFNLRAGSRWLGLGWGISCALIGLTTSGILGGNTARQLLGHGVVGIAMEILWWTCLIAVLNLPNQSESNFQSPTHPSQAVL